LNNIRIGDCLFLVTKWKNGCDIRLVTNVANAIFISPYGNIVDAGISANIILERLAAIPGAMNSD